MPTGYTHRLSEMDFNTQRWLKETVIRAMGVSIIMRDDSLDLSEQEIIDRLKRDLECQHHFHEWEKARKENSLCQSRTQDEWEKLYYDGARKNQLDYKARVKVHELEKEKHKKVLDDLEQMKIFANDKIKGEERTLILETLRFAIQQVEQSLLFDYSSGVYRDSSYDRSLEDWIEAKKRKAEESSIRTGENYLKYRELAKERLELYLKFIEFVNATGKEHYT